MKLYNREKVDPQKDLNNYKHITKEYIKIALKDLLINQVKVIGNGLEIKLSNGSRAKINILSGKGGCLW